MEATTTRKARPALEGLDAYAEAFQALHDDDETVATEVVWAGVAHVGPPIYKGGKVH